MEIKTEDFGIFNIRLSESIYLLLYKKIYQIYKL